MYFWDSNVARKVENKILQGEFCPPEFTLLNWRWNFTKNNPSCIHLETFKHALTLWNPRILLSIEILFWYLQMLYSFKGKRKKNLQYIHNIESIWVLDASWLHLENLSLILDRVANCLSLPRHRIFSVKTRKVPGNQSVSYPNSRRRDKINPWDLHIF